MTTIRIKDTPRPRRSRIALLIRALLFGVFLLLALYLIVSSSWFLKSVVLPRAGKAAHATVTVGDITLHPFSELTIEDLKVTPEGGATLLTAKRVHAGYNLMAILRGNILVEDLTLETPVITIVEDANGHSNLETLTEGNNAQPAPPATKSSAAPHIDIKSIALKNASVRVNRTLSSGEKVVAEIANVNITAGNLKNGATGKLDISAALALDKSTMTSKPASSLQSLLNVSFTFDLLENLNPGAIKGLAAFSVGRAGGEFADLAGLIAKLDCELSPTELKKLSLTFNKGPALLGEVRLTGPFDTGKTEGKLKLEVLSVDRQVLNLVGAASGIDFGTTKINATTDITLSQGGRMIATAGRVDVARLQVIQASQTSPTLDVDCNFDTTFDRVGQSLLLKTLSVNGAENQQPFLHVNLANPMTIAFADTVNAPDAGLDLVITNLNLANWRAFAPKLGVAGIVNTKARINSRDGGKALSLELDQSIGEFAIQSGADQLAVTGIQFHGTLAKTPRAQSVVGALKLTGINLAAAAGTPLQLALNLDATLSNNTATVRQCLLQLTPTTRASNEISLTGVVDLSAPKTTGTLLLKSDALDFTSYYDLFAGKTTTTNAAAASPAPAATSNVEPAAVSLPLRNFNFTAQIGKFHLREIAATNFQTTVLLDGSHVVLKPFTLTLNNAPVTATADLDLSVPGYRYEVLFNAGGIPLEPLANTFSPTYRGQAQGTLIANVAIKGAGMTGGNLRTNLAGTVLLSFTNANIQLVGPKVKAILTPIAIALRTEEIFTSPLDYLTADLVAGGGKIDITRFSAQGPALRADTAGSIPIADVLNDSVINQPLEISLARRLATQLSFSSVSTNEAYAKLPTFVQLTGTLGNPRPKIDETKLVVMAAAGEGTAILKNVGGKAAETAGGALNLIGGLLGGKPAATNPPASTQTTNAPATNAAPPSVLDVLRGLKK